MNKGKIFFADEAYGLGRNIAINHPFNKVFFQPIPSNKSFNSIQFSSLLKADTRDKLENIIYIILVY